MRYDENLDLYHYQIDANNSIFPRNEKQQLININNVDSFYTKLEEVDFKYSFDESIEQDDLLRFKDHQIAKNYSDFIMPTIQF